MLGHSLCVTVGAASRRPVQSRHPGIVAHLGEHCFRTAEVAGSIPVGSTSGLIAQWQSFRLISGRPPVRVWVGPSRTHVRGRVVQRRNVGSTSQMSLVRLQPCPLVPDGGSPGRLPTGRVPMASKRPRSRTRCANVHTQGVRAALRGNRKPGTRDLTCLHGRRTSPLRHAVGTKFG